MEILDTVGWSLIWVVVVLGVMIFVHELGHYLMAKLLGIRVEVFSLGFGPRLVGFQKGDTDYRISGVPLGGYVKMRGENWDEDLTGSEDEFLSRPKTHRLAVAVAGPFMNIAMAVVLLAGIYMAGIQVPVYLSQPPIIGYVAEKSPADDAGLRQGDRILSVGGTQTPDWESEQLAVATDPGQTVPIEILREGKTFERLVHIAEEPRTGAGLTSWQHFQRSSGVNRLPAVARRRRWLAVKDSSLPPVRAWSCSCRMRRSSSTSSSLRCSRSLLAEAIVTTRNGNVMGPMVTTWSRHVQPSELLVLAISWENHGDDFPGGTR